MVGRQAEASITSGVTSALRNTRPRPVWTLVAVMNSLIGALRQLREVDALGQHLAQRVEPARVEVVGREQARGQVHGDEHGRVVKRPAAEQHVERPALERARPRGLGHPAPEGIQGGARAPARRPAAWPATITAAFIAPAEVPEIPTMCSHGSSSSRSSTPQVKAPCEPPPCRARSTATGAALRCGRVLGPVVAHGHRRSVAALQQAIGRSAAERHAVGGTPRDVAGAIWSDRRSGCMASRRRSRALNARWRHPGCVIIRRSTERPRSAQATWG